MPKNIQFLSFPGLLNPIIYSKQTNIWKKGKEERTKIDLLFVTNLSWMVEFCQTPIDESEFAIFVIDHDIVRLHVSVHDSHAMAIIQCFEEFVEVIPDIVVRQCLIQL